MADTVPWCPGVTFVGPEEPGYEEVWEAHNRRCERIWQGHGLAVAAHMLNQFEEDEGAVEPHHLDEETTPG